MTDPYIVYHNRLIAAAMELAVEHDDDSFASEDNPLPPTVAYYTRQLSTKHQLSLIHEIAHCVRELDKLADVEG